MSSDGARSELEIRTYQPADKDAVVELWRRCSLIVPTEGAGNDPYEDIKLKLAFQPDLFFVGTLADRVVASVMAGYEGHRGWINYLAVAPECRRQGIGTRIMLHTQEALRALGCVKINLQVRESNQAVLAFYAQLGFSNDHVLSLGKRLKPAKEQTT